MYKYNVIIKNIGRAVISTTYELNLTDSDIEHLKTIIKDSNGYYDEDDFLECLADNIYDFDLESDEQIIESFEEDVNGGPDIYIDEIEEE